MCNFNRERETQVRKHMVVRIIMMMIRVMSHSDDDDDQSDQINEEGVRG